MTTDATQVTGSPLSGGARAGDVLAERYELLEAVDADGPSLGYRALDHETERQVLVRTLAGGPLDERTLGEVVERLRGLIGVGGRYLSSLLDVDRENRRPFIVEAWPAGTQLSAIIAARRARGEALSAVEMLPVLARIVAALAALPDPWHHGDIRTERVWLDTDGLRLTGAYLLAALPSRLVGERIEALGPGALAYAPEVARGRSGPAADRWAVAALVWESLTSRAPDVRTDPPELSPEARIALRRLLDPEPGRRAVDLSALLAALAAQASLAVPALDPEPHRPPTADIGAPPDRMGPPRARPVAGAADEGTQEISLDQIVEERAARAARRPIPGAAQDGTQEIALEEIVEEAGADDTAKHSAVSGEQDLDPRLVRAALGITLESERRASGPDSLDPRLVRAALDVTSDEGSGLEELPSDELEVVEEDRAKARAPRAKASAPAAAAPSPRAAAPVAARPSPAPSAARPAPSARPAPAPSARPSPAPSPRPAPAPSARPTPAPSAAAPRPASAAPSAAGAPARARSPSPAPQPAPIAPAPSPSPARPAASGADGGTAVVQRPEEPPRPAPRRPFAGPLIVIGALVLAIAIVGAGFLIRSWITRERDSEERSRHIQERLRQIRDEESVPAP